MLEVVVPGDQVLAFLRSRGAHRTDAANDLEEGRHQDNIARYVALLEAGKWWESPRPIYLDARSGTVWQGTDRTAALARVDWTKAPTIPSFHIIVEHPHVSP